MEEIILKKESVHKTKINTHLFQTIYSFIDENKDNFLSRSWDCNIKTSLNLYPNILHNVGEFKYIRQAITNKIEDMLVYSTGNRQPFYIESSWLNVLFNICFSIGLICTKAVQASEALVDEVINI